jgi:glycosyltransferase involved in cell wall biosynthesis
VTILTASHVGTPKDVSVILPTLNEEETIGICIQKIQRVFQENGLDGEIIVSDSSTDKTPEIARSYSVNVIHPKSRGYGSAYIEAFKHVRGNYVVIGDADNTYDFSEMPLLLKELDQGAELVIGSRFRGTIKDGAMKPLHRYIGNPLLTWILNLVFGTQYSDTHSGFRAIRADSLAKLNLQSTGMEFASEMLVKASKANLKISEVPITYYPRIGPSKLTSFSDGWRHVRFILLLKPISFLAIPGILGSIFGIILMAAFYASSEDPTGRTHSFILGTLLLAGGLQLFLSGMVIKVYSAVHGFEEKEGIVISLLNYRNLEVFLGVGSASIVSGLILGLFIFYEWIHSGFGQLNQIANAVLSLSLVIIGLEIIFMAVFISMMCLNDASCPQ